MENEIFKSIQQLDNRVKVLFKSKNFHNKYDGILHAAVGLSTEVGEIAEIILDIDGDFENDDVRRIAYTEELGDCSFYISAIAQQGLALGAPDENNKISAKQVMEYCTTDGRSLNEICTLINQRSSEILTQVKKSWVYGKELDFDLLLVLIFEVVVMLNIMAKNLGITEDEINKHNAAKLYERYKDGYSDEFAIKRLDKVDEQ